jgi:HK97 family phage major capsid protein
MTAPTMEVKSLRKTLEAKTARIQEISDAFKMDDAGNVEVTTEMATEFKSAVNDARELRGMLEAAQGLTELREWMDQAPPSVAAAHAADAQRGQTERKTLGDVFIESKSFQERRSDTKPFIRLDVDSSIHEMKDIYGGSQTPTGGSLPIPGLGGVQNIGITEQRLRRKHVRDLFPHATTTASVLYGVRETGFTNNAAQVSVRTPDNTGFVSKPYSDLTLAPVMYPVCRVAHLLKSHKDILADEPRLKDFLNRRMTDGIALAEDRDILFGVGGAERMTGIMNTPGIQVYTGLSADKFTKQLRKAATRAMLAEFDPTGLILHPLDWEELELEETGQGQYRLAINVAVGGEKRIWGLDIVATTAMTEGRYLLGAFGMGATVYDREKVGVQISTENDDDFEKNLITIRCESRLATVVDRPESFVAGTLTDYVAA